MSPSKAGDDMGKDAWPVKLILGGGGVLVAISDLTFGSNLSSGVLLLVGGLVIAEGVSDRSKANGD